MILVERTAPLLTVQDSGRFGYRADGVTTSGPLDALALAVANGLVGNSPRDAVLEGCLGGARFHFERHTTFAVTGADLAATLDDELVETYAKYEAKEDSVLTIERITKGAIWYLAVGGGIDVPVVLGSRSTLVTAGLGGLGGAPIRNRSRLDVGIHPLERRTPSPVPGTLRTPLNDAPIPLLPGPHGEALSQTEWAGFYSGTFTVSRASSRVGYRLEGPLVPAHLPADLASEPACAGAMQLPPEGQPIVLMADHPTVGGYPIIGVVPAHALGRFAQRAPGAHVRFQSETIADAVAHVAAQREILERWLGAP